MPYQNSMCRTERITVYAAMLAYTDLCLLAGDALPQDAAAQIRRVELDAIWFHLHARWSLPPTRSHAIAVNYMICRNVHCEFRAREHQINLRLGPTAKPSAAPRHSVARQYHSLHRQRSTVLRTLLRNLTEFAALLKQCSALSSSAT